MIINPKKQLIGKLEIERGVGRPRAGGGGRVVGTQPLYAVAFPTPQIETKILSEYTRRGTANEDDFFLIICISKYM